MLCDRAALEKEFNSSTDYLYQADGGDTAPLP
jgi:hypothetical protein